MSKLWKKKQDLEIDHILPISKGGKSTIDNLQTLCKTCNKEKSDLVIPFANIKKTNTRYCIRCKAPMKVLNGPYGKFYGCMNYPKYDYTEKY